MRTELRAKPHGVLTVELCRDGQFIGAVVGADGPGARIITKHAIKAMPSPDDGSGINVLKVGIVVNGG